MSMIAVLSWVLFTVRRGPTEWISYSTLLPEKSIYFYRTPSDKGFDEFVELLDACIAQHSPFGHVGEGGAEVRDHC